MLVFKSLFESIIGQFSISDNVIYNYVVMALIGAIAYRIAFRTVGTLYRQDIIDGGFVGSLLHWLIRLIVFVALFIFVWLMIFLVKLIIQVPTWVWFTLLATLIIGIIAYIARKIFAESH